MKKFVIFLIIVNIISFFSCKKDEVLSKTELLCHSPWILSASTINPPFVYEGGTIVDWYSGALLPCEKDDVWYFNKSGTFKIDEGDNKCDENDYEIYQLGIWAFDDNEEYLYTGFLIYLNEYTILTLNEIELKVSHIWWYDSITYYTITETFIHY